MRHPAATLHTKAGQRLESLCRDWVEGECQAAAAQSQAAANPPDSFTRVVICELKPSILKLVSSLLPCWHHVLRSWQSRQALCRAASPTTLWANLAAVLATGRLPLMPS